MDYKAKVLEHFGAELETDYDKYQSGRYDIEYTCVTTADDYQIYHRTDGGSSIFYDQDLFYYADGCIERILEDLEEGLKLFVDAEIAEECGLEEEGYVWEELYGKYVEEDVLD